jgi:hypothetical protein
VAAQIRALQALLSLNSERNQASRSESESEGDGVRAGLVIFYLL